MTLDAVPRRFEPTGEDGRLRAVDLRMPYPRNFATFSEVRYSRIEELRKQIAARTYRVPAADLAQKLMHRMLLPAERWTSAG